jgi:large subunit ribosomal protein L18
MKARTARARRVRRHLRVRKRVDGSEQRPRLSVFRSAQHIYAQLIDDSHGKTLVAASDLDAELRSARDGKQKTEIAKLVGQAIGRRAIEAGIRQVVFDRGGFRYHGRVKALADSARESGLQF